MPHQNDPKSNSEEFLKLPAEEAINPTIDQIPARALDQAIENLIEAGSLAPAPNATVPTDDLIHPSASAPVQAPESLADAPEELDPLHPGKEVWKALEQEADEEEKAKRREPHFHHPTAPEELRDVRNR
jgi:hypothetical protein